MKHYIDKDALVAMIKSRMATNKHENPLTAAAYVEDEDILEAINTLEVREVDLEKEIDNIWNPRFNLGWDEKSLLSMNREGFTTIAKHFFELGLKAQKGE